MITRTNTFTDVTLASIKRSIEQTVDPVLPNSIDLYTAAFQDGKAARVAGNPRTHNPHALAAAALGVHERVRMANSWDAGWLFGRRGWK